MGAANAGLSAWGRTRGRVRIGAGRNAEETNRQAAARRAQSTAQPFRDGATTSSRTAGTGSVQKHRKRRQPHRQNFKRAKVGYRSQVRGFPRPAPVRAERFPAGNGHGMPSSNRSRIPTPPGEALPPADRDHRRATAQSPANHVPGGRARNAQLSGAQQQFAPAPVRILGSPPPRRFQSRRPAPSNQPGESRPPGRAASNSAASSSSGPVARRLRADCHTLRSAFDGENLREKAALAQLPAGPMLTALDERRRARGTEAGKDKPRIPASSTKRGLPPAGVKSSGPWSWRGRRTTAAAARRSPTTTVARALSAANEHKQKPGIRRQPGQPGAAKAAPAPRRQRQTNPVGQQSQPATLCIGNRQLRPGAIADNRAAAAEGNTDRARPAPGPVISFASSSVQAEGDL